MQREMLNRLPRILSILLLFVVATAAHASADPVRVTTGVVGFDSGDPFHFVLRGDGFEVAGSGDFGTENPGVRCFPCPSGSRITLDAFYEGPDQLGSGIFSSAERPVFFDGFLRIPGRRSQRPAEASRHLSPSRASWLAFGMHRGPEHPCFNRR